MAEGHSDNGVSEAVEEVLQSEHADGLRASGALMVPELTEAELARHLGAEHGERAPERRLTQRNGYRCRGVERVASTALV